MTRFYDHLVAAAAQKSPFALALISGTKGSSPQRLGAKALFFADGKMAGTLGGGCLEAEVHARAKKAMKTGQPAAFEMLLDHDFGWDDGLICGGSVRGLILPHAGEAGELWRKLATPNGPIRWGVKNDFSISFTTGDTDSSNWLYTETVVPPSQLWIAGSGHVAQAVAPLALKLDFAVTVFDDRPDLANHEFFPPETELRVAGWHKLLNEYPASPSYGLIVTRGHQHDALVLTEWIHRSFIFLGMIGSRRKARVIRERLMRECIATAEQLNEVACPVGADITAQSTQEIAVSIMAQYIQKRAEHNQLKKKGK